MHWWYHFFTVDLCLQIVYGVIASTVASDCVTGDCLDENLRSFPLVIGIGAIEDMAAITSIAAVAVLLLVVVVPVVVV